MAQSFAYGGLALKAVEEQWVSLKFRMWKFQRHDASIARIHCAIDRGHPTCLLYTSGTHGLAGGPERAGQQEEDRTSEMDASYHVRPRWILPLYLRSPDPHYIFPIRAAAAGCVSFAQ